jgi:hypothetical protein
MPHSFFCSQQMSASISSYHFFLIVWRISNYIMVNIFNIYIVAIISQRSVIEHLLQMISSLMKACRTESWFVTPLYGNYGDRGMKRLPHVGKSWLEYCLAFCASGASGFRISYYSSKCLMFWFVNYNILSYNFEMFYLFYPLSSVR